MEQHLVSEKALRYQEYIAREENLQHHTYEEELRQFDLLRAGDPRALEERARARASDQAGTVSLDPIRNAKYLSVVTIAIACRTAIQAGLAGNRAFMISDLYIQKMDLMDSVEEINQLADDAFAFYLKEIQSLTRKKVFSKPVSICLDYIYNHLHEPISVRDLAVLTELSPSYLSTLFKSEMGESISEYIMSKKMEAARNMLRYTNYTYADISSILNFSSQSHFIRVFKAHHGETPKRFREKNYRLTGEEGEM